MEGCTKELPDRSLPAFFLPPNPGYSTETRGAKYLGGIDFILLSGSSNTLGLASGVTDMYGAGTDVERRYLISS